jgi:hypothetical protein
VVRLRGVIRQRLIHGRRGGRVPVDEPGTEKNLEGIIREDDDHCLRRAPARLPSASSVARRLLLLPAIGSWGRAGDWKSKLELAKVSRLKAW